MTVPNLTVGLARVLRGAEPFKFEHNINDTYRGRVLVANNEIRLGFIKDLDSKQLANELLAASLAMAAGLPVPQPFLGYVAAGDLPVMKAPSSADDNGRYVFVSLDAETPALWQCYNENDESAYNAACKKLVEWAQTGLLYGFDSWIANTDRHQGNLLFEGDRVYLIDHGHAFAGPAWKVGDLVPAAHFTNKLKLWLTEHIPHDDKEKLLAAAMAVATLANDNTLQEAQDGSKFGQFLTEIEVPALVKFLKARSAHLQPLVADALGTDSGVA